MRILSITAQKPNSTGSGIYLTELVKEYGLKGHTQAVVAGVYREDVVELPEGVDFYPVYFGEGKLPFPIVGMSDEMPYQSTRYCDMTPNMTARFEEAFLEVITLAVGESKPDLILCHHLYLLTALVRKHFPTHRVYGFCHNTDLRQMCKTDLRREFIREQIRRLNRIFVPQKAQREGVLSVYKADPERIETVGMGYNSQIFHGGEKKPEDGITRIVFAGKIAEKKGVMSLIRSLSVLHSRKSACRREELLVQLAGSAGNEKEYGQILKMAKECPYEIRFLGRLSQQELACVYRESDIFVLPSFFDGLPLTVIEALACRDRVVMSDLPGIREWLQASAPGGDVRFVEMPKMQNTDEPVADTLPAFEERLADALLASIRTKESKTADVSRISWEGIAARVLM